MQMKMTHYDDIAVKWIPYKQFNYVKEIGTGRSDVMCTADTLIHFNKFKV
jgi:hypothetical protein